MTTYTAAVNDPNKALEIFQQLDTDEQLALLWFVYRQMGHFITPAAPGAASGDIAAGLYQQLQRLGQQDQLKAMRAIAERDQNSQLSREYGSLSSNTKLAFWYYLAQGMDRGDIISMPEEYSLSADGSDLLAALESMNFEEQITVLRNAANAMGSQPAPGSKV